MTKLKTRLLKDLPIKTTPITDDDYVVNTNNGTTKLKVKDITKNLEQNVNKLNNDVKEILEKGTTVETIERVTKQEIDRQIADGTIANLTLIDESVTLSKLSPDVKNNMLRPNEIALPKNEILELSADIFDGHAGATQWFSICCPVNASELKKGRYIKFKVKISNLGSVRCVLVSSDKQILARTGYIEINEHEQDVIFSLDFIDNSILTNNMWIGLEGKDDSCKLGFQNVIPNGYYETVSRKGCLYKDNSYNGFAMAAAWYKFYYEIFNISYGEGMSEQLDAIQTRIKDLEYLETKLEVGDYSGTFFSAWSNGWAYPFYASDIGKYNFDVVTFYSKFKTSGLIDVELVILNENKSRKYIKSIQINVKANELAKINISITKDELINVCNGFIDNDIVYLGYESKIPSLNSRADNVAIKYPNYAGNSIKCLYNTAYGGGYSEATNLDYNNTYIAFSHTKLGIAESNIKMPQIILPKEIDMVVGDTIEIFKTGVNDAKYPASLNFYTTKSGCINAHNRIIYTPTNSESGEMEFYLMDGYNVLANETRKFTVRNKPTRVSPKNILCIGDSLTASGIWVEELRRRLTGTGGTPQGLQLNDINFIGTCKKGDTCFEGRNGWSWYSYTGNNSPFYINGKQDMATYVQQQGVSKIDICYILLGWNHTGANITDVIKGAKVLIDNIHSAFPDCKIILMGLQPKHYDNHQMNHLTFPKANEWIFSLNKQYQLLVEEDGYNNFMDYVDLAYQIDIINNATTNTRPINVRNPRTEVSIVDAVHLSTFGYLQIADAVYRNIIKHLL